MKYRNGFVSNSSSSSFIITNKEYFDKAKEILKRGYNLDYFELNNKLYTCSIHDCNDVYYEINELSSDSEEYLEDSFNWIGVEGELGIQTVYVPRKEFIQSYKLDNKIAEEVLYTVQQFIDDNDIFCEECIYEDSIIEQSSLEFIQSLCEIVGYKKEIIDED
jgi:hypothetical protein